MNILKHSKMLQDNNIEIIYAGPIWADGIDGMAKMLLKRLEFDGITFNASQSVFSIFVEQMNNMMMYSAEKEQHVNNDGVKTEAAKGIFILGIKNSTYFIQTGNAVKASSAKILKERIDRLNNMDKKELRQYYGERINSDNSNPESRGAGVGLIEIARRASSPIEYELEPLDNDLQYFTMYVKIKQGEKDNNDEY